MTAGELRREGDALLRRADLPCPERECAYLLSGILHVSPFELDLAPGRELSPEEETRLRSAFARRAAREPAQYIIGSAPFRELELEVTPDVLIPRPETEELIDPALSRLAAGAKVLDMGTGSGAIAIALKTERPDLDVTAADASPGALAVARRNAARYEARISFILSDLWEAFSGKRFDFLAANLPYVSDSEYFRCEKEIFFEPRSALTAPEEGLSLIGRCIAGLGEHLTPGGGAVFEVGGTQARAVCALGEKAGFAASVRRDMAGKERFVVLCL